MVFSNSLNCHFWNILNVVLGWLRFLINVFFFSGSVILQFEKQNLFNMQSGGGVVNALSWMNISVSNLVRDNNFSSILGAMSIINTV